MADNRLYLVCRICRTAGVDDATVMLGKCFAQEWEVLGKLDEKVQAFFDAHGHFHCDNHYALEAEDD